MRRALVGWTALAGLGACDRVFDLDPVRPSVSGTFALRFVENDENGEPVITERPFEATAKLRHGDTVLDVPIVAGAFGAEVPEDVDYSLHVTTPISSTRYQLEARQLDLVERFLGRPERIPPASGTVLEYQVLDRAPTETDAAEVVSTGIWTRTSQLASTPSEVAFVVRWDALASQSGPPGLLEASHHDGLAYFGYDYQAADAGGQYIGMTRFASQRDVTLNDGAVTTVSGNANPIQTYCYRLAGRRVEELARVQGASDPAFSSFEVGLAMLAVPTKEIGPFAPFVLGYASTITTVGLEFPLNVMGGNPLAGYDTLALMGVVLRIGRNDGPTVTVNVVTPASAFCPTETILLDGIVAIPSGVRLDGMPVDGSDIAASEAAARVEWDVSTGPADYYVVSLADAAGPIETVVTTRTEAIFEPGIVKAQHAYRLSVEARVGFPGVHEGNLRPFEFPRGTATLQSALFVVR